MSVQDMTLHSLPVGLYFVTLHYISKKGIISKSRFITSLFPTTALKSKINVHVYMFPSFGPETIVFIGSSSQKGENANKHQKKKNVILEKHYFDHRPPFVLGDY